MASNILAKFSGNYSKRELKRIQRQVDAVLELEKKYKAMGDEELKAQTPRLKERLKGGSTLNDILPEDFVTLVEREKLSMSRVMVVMPYILLLKIEGGSGIIKM